MKDTKSLKRMIQEFARLDEFFQMRIGAHHYAEIDMTEVMAIGADETNDARINHTL